MADLINAFETRGEAIREKVRRRAKGEYWNDVFMSESDLDKPFYVGTYMGFVNWECALRKKEAA